jgi:hypothetical protein
MKSSPIVIFVKLRDTNESAHSPFCFPTFSRVLTVWLFLCLQYFFIVKHVCVLKMETRLNIKKNNEHKTKLQSAAFLRDELIQIIMRIRSDLVHDHTPMDRVRGKFLHV